MFQKKKKGEGRRITNCGIRTIQVRRKEMFMKEKKREAKEKDKLWYRGKGEKICL